MSAFSNSFKKPVSKTFLYAFFCALFFFSIQIFMMADWYFSGEFWAESGTNYFRNASSGVWSQVFFSHDAGYIPFFLRIVSFFPVLLHFPSSSVAHYYNFLSLVMPVLFVAPFCLRIFRPLLHSDFLRFLCCICVLFVGDFETKNYINVSYYSIFFLIISTALMFRFRNKKFFSFLWSIPLLLTAKPYCLIVVPLFVFLLFSRERKYRILALFSFAIASLQVYAMSLNNEARVIVTTDESIHFLSKVYATLGYFFGMIWLVITGPTLNHYLSGMQVGICIRILGGVSLVVLFCLAIKFRVFKRPELLFVAIFSIFTNSLLNNFAQSIAWNSRFEQLTNFLFYRHSIAFYFGGLLVVSYVLGQAGYRWPKYRNLLSTALIVWFSAVGWAALGEQINQLPPPPRVGVSLWSKMADYYDHSEVACVPINPFGWSVDKNCRILNHEIRDEIFVFNPPTKNTDIGHKFEYVFPSTFFEKKVMSIAMFIKTNSVGKELVRARGFIEDVAGRRYEVEGTGDVGFLGGIVLLSSPETLSVNGISKVSLEFNQSISVAYAQGKPTLSAILVLGQ